MARALFLTQNDGDIEAEVRTFEAKDLPDGEVQVAILYSSLNYKDGLAVTGAGKIIRGDFPFIPGIDLVGRVETSTVPAFEPGDLVVQTGGGLGETTWGGYSQQQRLSARWLVPLPEGLSPHAAMVIGTAGFTAMLSVMALEHQGCTPAQGEVVVTGASGGVGSMAVALLAGRGYDVVASTGSEEAHAYLGDLGAARIIGRFEGRPERAMASARWAGAVDTVGGDTLATVITELDRHASVAVCGNAGGFEVQTTVFPFILRGANLLGIDSNTATLDQRGTAWRRLADELSSAALERIHAETIGLDEIPAKSTAILDGAVRGRIVVDVRR